MPVRWTEGLKLAVNEPEPETDQQVSAGAGGESGHRSESL